MTDPTALLEAATREAHAAVEQLGVPYLLDSRHPKKLIEDTKASIDRALRIAERVGEMRGLRCHLQRDCGHCPGCVERDRLLAALREGE